MSDARVDDRPVPAGGEQVGGSGPADAPVAGGAGSPGRGRERLRQAGAVFRAELRKLLLAPGTLGLLLLAGLPPGLFAIAWLARALTGREMAVADATGDFAQSYQFFLLPIVVFFGCVVVFTNLVRRELRDRTLHHYLLAPVRREVVLAAKYAAGVVATFVVFGGSTAVSFVLAYGPTLATDPVGFERFALGVTGTGHLAAYLGITLLACLGYGAVFLAFGLWFKGPILPALLVFGWERIHLFLPAALKKLSVAHYLAALGPVPVTTGPFAVLSEPPSPWLAVPGLLLLAAALLALSAHRFRGIEVLYAED